jgi:hypothetical protein
MISPDYRDRLIEYVEKYHPQLSEECKEIFERLAAEPVVRIGGPEPLDTAVPKF